MEFLAVQIACALLLAMYLAVLCSHKVYWFLAVGIYGASAVLTGGYLLADAFTGDGVTEAVLFHLIYGLDGVKLSEFLVYVLAVILFGLALLSSFVFFWRALQHRKGLTSKYKIAELVTLGSLSIFAVILHPTTLQSAQIASDMLAKADIPLDEELANFNLQRAEGSEKKSLVYIYVESLEGIFLKEDVFPGLAPNLAALEQESLHIRGIRQAPLTDWTIAGMVASQCGIPLATFKIDRNDFSDVDGFLPGATCLGEILKQSGYYSVFMGGADLNFAGKGRFYKEHGFDEVIGRHELEAASKQPLPLSKWGVYDDYLLASAYERFKALADAEEPFALFLLTLDTHPPIGHKTPSCENHIYAGGESGILNAVHCSDKLISSFIRRIEQYAGDDLLVVVASDHLQMRNDIHDFLVARDAQRENLFFVRGGGIGPELIQRSATTLDIFPTLLNLMGWETDSAALGRNLLEPGETLMEKYGKDQFYSSLQKWRTQAWKTWSPHSTD